MRKSGKTTALVAVLLCGVTASLARHPIAAKAATPVDYPLITRLVGRHFRIVVAAGPQVPLYTVIGDKGEPLADHMTLAAIKQSNPALFNRISPALATTSVDASVDTGF